MSDPIDKLVTRDPQAMQHTLEDAEYAGSDVVEGLDSGLIEVRAGNASGMQAVPLDPVAASNPNPGYTPPGHQVAPHSREGTADLPEGAPAEAELEQGGQNR
ncbi:hypothetical protein Q0M94_15760 [Deinococcus radiomollis]|uniref:hypothetical protein n=1 Tax=Deinococcus radiomollis TaxID=468916 RepID=UPI003891EFC8